MGWSTLASTANYSNALSFVQVQLVIEILWPLFLFFILVGVRSTTKPIYKGQCEYKPSCNAKSAFVSLLTTHYLSTCYINQHLEQEQRWLLYMNKYSSLFL